MDSLSSLRSSLHKTYDIFCDRDSRHRNARGTLHAKCRPIKFPDEQRRFVTTLTDFVHAASDAIRYKKRFPGIPANSTYRSADPLPNRQQYNCYLLHRQPGSTQAPHRAARFRAGRGPCGLHSPGEISGQSSLLSTRRPEARRHCYASGTSKNSPLAARPKSSAKPSVFGNCR